LGERVSVRLQRILLNERKENEIGDAGRGIYAFAIVRKGIYIRYVSSSNSVSKRQDLKEGVFVSNDLKIQES
jgi:hypothetical protein